MYGNGAYEKQLVSRDPECLSELASGVRFFCDYLEDSSDEGPH